MKPKITDDEFIRKYEAYEHEALRETIDYLINRRQMLRDVELEKLEQEAKELLKKLQNIELEKLVEEIKCFKDVLSLHRRLAQNHGHNP